MKTPQIEILSELYMVKQCHNIKEPTFRSGSIGAVSFCQMSMKLSTVVMMS